MAEQFNDVMDESLEPFDQVEAIQHIEDDDMVKLVLPLKNGETTLVGYIMREFIDDLEERLRG